MAKQKILITLSLLLISAVVAVDLIDLQARPQPTLPAAPYAVAVLVAALVLDPAKVVAIAVCSLVALGLVEGEHQAPPWAAVMDLMMLVFIGFLATMLSIKNQREIALRSEAETALLKLQEAEEKFRLIALNSPDVMSHQDRDLRYRWIIHPVASLTEEQVVGKTDFDLLPREEAERLSAIKRRVLETGAGARVDVSFWRDGERRVYDMALEPWRDSAGKIVGVTGYGRDVTERRQAEARLLEQQRSLAVLEERGRLARELHDSLGQVLGYVSAEGRAIRRLIAMGETARADQYLSDLVLAAQDALADIREYICGVKATSAGRRLVAAVEDQLNALERRHGIRTELSVPPGWAPESLDPATELQLLRIVQEALANIRKHSAARSAKVVFKVDAGHLHVTVEDDGRGFGPEYPLDGDGHGFGLRVMQERAQEIGGSLRVVSAPGKGTRVVVQIPRMEGVVRLKDEIAVGG